MATPLKDFRDRATKEEREALAQAAQTTEGYLFNHLGVHRDVPIAKAAAIEAFTAGLAVLNKGRTPVIHRADLCADCAQCPHAPRGGVNG